MSQSVRSIIANPDIYSNNPGYLTGPGLAILRQNQMAIIELPGAMPEKTFIIADGLITPTQSALIIDTEGQSPADDLTTMSTEVIHDGATVSLRAADASRIITLKHGSGPGGIQLTSGVDVTLSNTSEISFRLKSGLWHEVPALRVDGVSIQNTNGVLSVQTATDTTRGIGRSATNGEVTSGTTGAGGPAWITPEQQTEQLSQIIAHLPVSGSFPGVMLQSYLSPGTHTFTAPDPKGDGQPFGSEVWLKAGGAGGTTGGSAGGVYWGGGGGGEGEFVKMKQMLTPGGQYSVVVGAGGEASSNGGTSVFNASVTAEGGLRGELNSGNAIGLAGGAGGGKATAGITQDMIRTPGDDGEMGGSPSNSGSRGGNGGGAGGSNYGTSTSAVLGGGGAAASYSGAGKPGGPGFCIIWKV